MLQCIKIKLVAYIQCEGGRTMDYRKLCVELFGTDDEATLRKIAAEYRKKNTRNAGRKRKIADEDIRRHIHAGTGKDIWALSSNG